MGDGGGPAEDAEDLLFEKQRVVASQQTTSLLGQMFEKNSSPLEPRIATKTSPSLRAENPPREENDKGGGGKAAAPLPSQAQHAQLTEATNAETNAHREDKNGGKNPGVEIDPDSVYTYADTAVEEDENGLPFFCKVWLPNRKNVSVEISESSNSSRVITSVVKSCRTFKTTEELENICKLCKLFAADEKGNIDEDCPPLDTRRPIHKSGLRHFVLFGSGDEKIKDLTPSKKVVLIGAKRKSMLDDPKTKFLHAAEMGDLRLVKRLLASRLVEVEDKGIDNWTALHYAARSGKYNIVLYLVKHDANLDAISKTGWTPLHLACYQGHYDAADILLQSGANPNIKDNDGKWPAVYAENKGANDILELLEEYRNDADLM